MTLHVIFNFQENTYRKHNFVSNYKATPHFHSNKKILTLYSGNYGTRFLKFTNFSTNLRHFERLLQTCLNEHNFQLSHKDTKC